MQTFQEWLVSQKNPVIIAESKKPKPKRKKKWIQKAVKHPGRCADMGGPDCPEGSPQYNLAKRFKSGEFKKKRKNK